MRNRFYLLSLVLFVTVFLSQARGSMPLLASPDDEAVDTLGNDTLVIDTLVTDTLVIDTLVTDTLVIDTLVTDTIVPVAIVNADSLFASLTEAFYSATDTAETNIQLLDDASMGLIVINQGVVVSLDLNGHKVDIDSLGIYNYGTLLITDSSEDSSGEMSLDHGNVSMIYNYGELTIEGGSFILSSPTVSDNDFRRCLITFDGSKTSIKNGLFASTAQALCLYGETTIDDGVFLTTGNCDIIANYCTSKELVIGGGTFSNATEEVTGIDKRRCLWTNSGTSTLIKDGTFTSGGQVLFLMGGATIDGGDYTSVGNTSVVANYIAEGELVINYGTFQNLGSTLEEGSDQRSCVFTNKNTKTVIADASFSSPCQVLVLNGDATISSGRFVTTGNTNVVGNYNTTGELVISGGTFINSGIQPEESDEIDNHRCLWGSMGTTTNISGGSFTNNSTAQTITIYGIATVSGGTITNNGHGSGIASNGAVEITGCRISAWNMLICWEGATMVCSGGLFSEPIPEELLADGCKCVNNSDPVTMDAYPYKVIKGTPGDVNGDDAVNVADISSVISVMAGGESEEMKAAADVNGDGNVDVADISTIISIMAGE